MGSLWKSLSEAFDEGHQTQIQGLLSDDHFAPERLRRAAVLIAITDRPEPGVILTYRPSSMRDHAGQIAFPGGKIDQGETAIEAALREAEEELSISPEAVQIIGESDLFVSATGFSITPVVGLVPAEIAIESHPEEVDGWFEAPLAFLLDTSRFRQGELNVRGEKRSFQEIDWEGHRIWGVTASILHNLSRRLEGQKFMQT